jgi:hypothetical protein
VSALGWRSRSRAKTTASYWHARFVFSGQDNKGNKGNKGDKGKGKGRERIGLVSTCFADGARARVSGYVGWMGVGNSNSAAIGCFDCEILCTGLMGR